MEQAKASGYLAPPRRPPTRVSGTTGELALGDEVIAAAGLRRMCAREVCGPHPAAALHFGSGAAGLAGFWLYSG